MYANAALCERHRNPARTDAELQGGSVEGQVGNKIDNRIDFGGLEHVCG
jgi:hypothetical protein